MNIFNLDSGFPQAVDQRCRALGASEEDDTAEL
jgi:hypothetical protein